jgi:hypothetical protein
MLRRTVTYLWAVLLINLLAACGGQPIPSAPVATAVQPTHTPIAPTAAPAAPTAAVTQATAAAPTAAAAQPESPGAGAIPEGLTPEGYHVLGRADAPVTLVMYSDFL